MSLVAVGGYRVVLLRGTSRGLLSSIDGHLSCKLLSTPQNLSDFLHTADIVFFLSNDRNRVIEVNILIMLRRVCAVSVKALAIM